jgi:Flp pilus assembly protein TadG
MKFKSTMFSRARKTFVASTQGAGAVEFALVSLPLLLLIFGVIEFGRAMWTREGLQQVAIAGARCVGMVQTNCGTSGTYSSSMALSYIESQAASWSIKLTASNITVTNPTTCAGISGFAQVSITYTFASVVPTLISQFKGGIPLSASACFPVNTSSS